MKSRRNLTYQKAITHVVCDILMKERSLGSVINFIKETISSSNEIPAYLVKEIIADIEERERYHENRD